MTEMHVHVHRLKSPFLCDTENGQNSRNWGVENRKWQTGLSFSEIIWFLFAQNLGKFDRAFDKMLGKLYLLPPSPLQCLTFWGHTFAVLMLISALQHEEMPAEWPFCLFTSGQSVFLEHCNIS